MNEKERSRLKRHRSLRLKMPVVSERPRLVVNRSLKNLSAQIIDDGTNKAIVSLSTLNKEIKEKFAQGGNLKAADYFGQVFAQKAKEKGITKIIFDRAGYLYHGRIRAFAEALRKNGLEF